MANKICFMVMPFGKKKTGLEPGKGPPEVDFNSLWDNAFVPLIQKLGYEPVRADADTSALIIHEMIERLAYSDLVIADISISNANVYYEIGVRHAARSTGCVLVSADWSQPVFDLAQIRRLNYPLPHEYVSTSDGKLIQERLSDGVSEMASSNSPVLDVIPGIQSLDKDLETVDLKQNQFQLNERVKQFKDKMSAAINLAANINIVQDMPSSTTEKRLAKREAAIAIRDQTNKEGRALNSIQVEVMRLLRDCADWKDVVEYIESMDDSLKANPTIQEQRLLALSNDQPEAAVAHLNLLIKNHGPSSERYGLLGGRHKRLFQQAEKESDENEAKRHLNLAIEAYNNGLTQDLNDYYPTCNLPPLLRLRNQTGDEDLAKFAARLTVVQCERARTLGVEDEWLNPTLLTNAFSAGDFDEAEKWVGVVELESPAQWKLDSTITTVEQCVESIEDSALNTKFQSLVKRLRKLIA